MDHYETAGAHYDAFDDGDDKLTVADFSLLALLCLMSVATILTLVLKG